MCVAVARHGAYDLWICVLLIYAARLILPLRAICASVLIGPELIGPPGHVHVVLRCADLPSAIVV